MKGKIGGGPNGGGGIFTNKLPDALTFLIHELRLCTKDFQPLVFLNCIDFILLMERQSLSIHSEFFFCEERSRH